MNDVVSFGSESSRILRKGRLLASENEQPGFESLYSGASPSLPQPTLSLFLPLDLCSSKMVNPRGYDEETMSSTYVA